MNNATLALNVSRPAAPATPSPAGHDKDDSSSSRRFDAALDAAHANARESHDPKPQTHTQSSHPSHPSHPSQEAQQARQSKPGDDSAPSAKTADARKSDRKPDDDSDTNDDADDDTSIAATMLSLIGVPPKVTAVAAKVLDKVTGTADAADAVPGAPTALLGLLPAAAGVPAALASALPGTAAGAHAAVEGLSGLNDVTASLAGTAAPTTAATVAGTTPSFDSLLAAQGLGVAPKDGASVDPANPSPMPFAHSLDLSQASAPTVQVQATHVATSPQFAQELGEQIAWMGSGDVKEARIKLHPEELGSMDVRVSLDGGKVNVAIMAQHPAAVHAVQQTLSQLDSMLAHHGLSLGQADVGQRQAERGGDSSGNGQATAGQRGDGDSVNGADTIVTTRVSRGLVDEVA